MTFLEPTPVETAKAVDHWHKLRTNKYYRDYVMAANQAAYCRMYGDIEEAEYFESEARINLMLVDA